MVVLGDLVKIQQVPMHPPMHVVLSVSPSAQTSVGLFRNSEQVFSRFRST